MHRTFILGGGEGRGREKAYLALPARLSARSRVPVFGARVIFTLSCVTDTDAAAASRRVLLRHPPAGWSWLTAAARARVGKGILFSLTRRLARGCNTSSLVSPYLLLQNLLLLSPVHLSPSPLLLYYISIPFNISGGDGVWFPRRQRKRTSLKEARSKAHSSQRKNPFLVAKTVALSPAKNRRLLLLRLQTVNKIWSERRSRPTTKTH